MQWSVGRRGRGILCTMTRSIHRGDRQDKGKCYFSNSVPSNPHLLLLVFTLPGNLLSLGVGGNSGWFLTEYSESGEMLLLWLGRDTVNSICLFSQSSQPACCAAANNYVVSSPGGKEVISLVTSQKDPENLTAVTQLMLAVILPKASLQMMAALEPCLIPNPQTPWDNQWLF